MEENFEFFKRLLAEVEQEFGLPPSEAELSFTDEEEIQTLNREYRNVDRMTDVLSFPALEGLEGRVDFEDFDLDPETGKLMLGDVILCVPQAARQAEEYGHSLEREIGYLELHSLLHLVGFDHMTDEEKGRMREAEEKLLARVNLTRE